MQRVFESYVERDPLAIHGYPADPPSAVAATVPERAHVVVQCRPVGCKALPLPLVLLPVDRLVAAAANRGSHARRVVRGSVEIQLRVLLAVLLPSNGCITAFAGSHVPGVPYPVPRLFENSRSITFIRSAFAATRIGNSRN